MKILFLSQVFPFPIDAGPKVRSYYNLLYLSTKHSVSLLSFVRGSDTNAAIEHMKTFCAEVECVSMRRSKFRDGMALLDSLSSGIPFLIKRDKVNEFAARLKELVRSTQFDVIHADQLWMAPYALMGQAEARQCGYSPAIVLDQHNAVFMVPKRMADSTRNILLKFWLQREASLMAKYESRICEQVDKVVWVTHEDQIAVNAIMPTLTSQQTEKDNFVIPICIEPSPATHIKTVPTSPNILFLGGMHWPPNADGIMWFANEIWSGIQKNISEANLFVVGKQPPKELASLGKHVISTGYVENTDSYWSTARVFIVPLRAGGGMRVKILDAWAQGVPVVATTIGAEGITCHPGSDILIADTPAEFTRAVLRVLSDDELALQLSKGGKQTLEKTYNWQKIYSAWDQVYDSISDIQEHPRSAA